MDGGEAWLDVALYRAQAPVPGFGHDHGGGDVGLAEVGGCLVRLVTAAVDRYGHIALRRDMCRLSRCTRACQEAEGLECGCSCMGAFHGENSGAWFEREGEVLVADRGEMTRAVVLYGPRKDDSEPGVYAGELAGRRYFPH